MSSEKLTGHGVGTGSFANGMVFVYPHLCTTQSTLAISWLTI